MQRVIAVGDHRPIEGREDAMAELRKLLSRREPLYRQAEITMDTSSRNIEEIVRDLTDSLGMATTP